MSIDPQMAATLAGLASAWAWESIGKDLYARAKDTASKHKDRFDWNKAAERYGRELYRQHSTMRILGKSDPVSLEKVFTDVYILDEVTGRLHYDIRKLRAADYDRFERDLHRGRRERKAGIELVQQGRNLFILGKPGAGKTTFLRYLTLQALEGELERTPIFVTLKQWSTSHETELMPFIVKQFAICGFPDPAAEPFVKRLLEEGKALVLFDGLDEVNRERDQRRSLVGLLQDFANQYNQLQSLITCRIAASEYMFAGMVQKMNYGRKSTFTIE